MFTVAGVSICNGEVKVRFCSDLVLRVKNLHKQGDTDIQLIELPNPMNKFDTCQFLIDSGQFTKYVDDIIEIQGKKAPKTSAPKVSVPKLEVDAEVEFIKELAEA
jgi:tRNA uridine 5-carbamoylmethylation protein Kti12